MRQRFRAFVGTLKRMTNHRMMRWAKKEYRILCAISFGNMLLAWLSVQLALANKNILDSAVGQDMASVKHAVAMLVLLTVIMLGLRILISSLGENCRMRLGQGIRQELMTSLLHKRYEAVQNYHSGDLTNRMLSDVRIVVDGMMGIVPTLLNMMTRLILASIVLFRLNWKFTVILYGIGLCILAGAAVFRRRIQHLHKEVQEEEGKVHSTIQETLANLRLIKASASEAHMEKHLAAVQNSHILAQLRRKTVSLIANAGLTGMMEASWLYTLVWGSLQLLRGTISYGTLTAMIQLVGQVQSPFSGVSHLLQRFYSMIASADRLEELLKLPEEAYSAETQASPHTFYSEMKALCIKNLSFSYDRSDVLCHVNGEIEKGDSVAITGLSGGGKSTLFLLMLGIYLPDKGSLCFQCQDGEKTVSLQTRSLFAYVPQGNVLFSGTIRSNLSMFRPDATDDEIMKAAEISCIADFLRSLPDGIDTEIGERGLGLSEGQAQRIAIARALLSQAPILLLDEATSALDEQTEAMLLRNIHTLRNRTCLIVTHRPAALAICNKQLILTDGCGTIQNSETT